MNKVIYILGGGTRAHVDSHLYLGSKASGTTARELARLLGAFDRPPIEPHNMDLDLSLTRMAYDRSDIDTVEDVQAWANAVVQDRRAKIVFFTAAMVDFRLQVDGWQGGGRLSSQGEIAARLLPNPKVVRSIRATRKDIFLVAFKQTDGATEDEQFQAGLNLLKASSANLVLANDRASRVNMIIVPEEAAYCVTRDRESALTELVRMALLRSHLTFTRSTVVSGDPVSWADPQVPDTLRQVVDYCIERGAYRRFRGVTAGHFAVKLDDQTFLTSRRKTDFNDMKQVGLVKVRTDGPDHVTAYGSRPSVGGQSQRIVFTEHPDADCIVHFHCQIREHSPVPRVSQREFECGSHECGRNTSSNLARFGNLAAVHLNNHGPNIVFSRNVDPQEVIAFIEANWDLTSRSHGYAPEIVHP